MNKEYLAFASGLPQLRFYGQRGGARLADNDERIPDTVDVGF